MTTTLSTLTTRLLQILGDNTTTPTRYLSALTQEAFRQAIGEYSIALPLITTATHTVTSAGREQTLTSLSRLIAITQVLYPWIDDTQEMDPLQLYYSYLRATLIVEAYANRDSDTNQVHAFGVEMLATFRQQLHTLRSQSSRQPLPTSGFKLDQWDGNPRGG
jgi:hypothetical protein